MAGAALGVLDQVLTRCIWVGVHGIRNAPNQLLHGAAGRIHMQHSVLAVFRGPCPRCRPNSHSKTRVRAIYGPAAEQGLVEPRLRSRRQRC